MRGVTPVITTILLLLISISVATIFFIWYSSFQKGLQQKIEEESKERVEELGYKIEVENVFCNATSDKVYIYIRNVGRYEIPEGEAVIYVYDSNQTFLGAQYINFPGLSVNAVYRFEITFYLEEGKEYYFKVTVPKYPTGSIGWCVAK